MFRHHKHTAPQTPRPRMLNTSSHQQCAHRAGDGPALSPSRREPGRHGRLASPRYPGVAGSRPPPGLPWRRCRPGSHRYPPKNQRGGALRRPSACGRAGARQRARRHISANGASNIPDSVDTTRAAAHGRSSQFHCKRTGQCISALVTLRPAPVRHCPRRQEALRQARAGLGAPGRGTSSTTQLPTTIHSFTASLSTAVRI